MLGHFVFECGGQVLYGHDDYICWCDSWIGKIFVFLKNSSLNYGCA